MDNHENTGTKASVLAKIREKQLTMRPKAYFTFEMLFVGLVSLVILAVSVALVSFVLFSLRTNGHDALLSFGTRGLETFLAVFPWPLLLLDILLVVFLETLLRRFKFGYRSPVLYLLIGLVAVALAFGLVLDRGTSVNDDLLRRADHGGLPPPFGELYEHVREPVTREQGIFRGTITALATSTLFMHQDDLDADGDAVDYTVILPPNVSSDGFAVGDHVYVAGDDDNGVVHAFGISKFPVK